MTGVKKQRKRERLGGRKEVRMLNCILADFWKERHYVDGLAVGSNSITQRHRVY